MAAIGPQRIKVVVDGPALRIAALNAAVQSCERHAFPLSEEHFLGVIASRMKVFEALLQQANEPETFGGGDDENSPDQS